jgi:hypothetical protein
MISIVDPEELKHVLRPTVYAAAVNELSSATSRTLPADRIPERRAGSDQRVSPSRND